MNSRSSLPGRSFDLADTSPAQNCSGADAAPLSTANVIVAQHSSAPSAEDVSRLLPQSLHPWRVTPQHERQSGGLIPPQRPRIPLCVHRLKPKGSAAQRRN